MESKELSPHQLQCRLADEPGSVILLDVREVSEREIVFIEGSYFIPMMEIPARLDEIQEISQDRELVVYCHHGVRSAEVVRWLNAQGYNRVLNLAGGIDAYASQLDPRMVRY